MKCRHCGTELNHTFIDLGSSPPSNSYLNEFAMSSSEKWYPLKVMVCHSCWLVQTEDIVGIDEMFSEEYAYFSSFSTSWLEHAKNYVEKMISRFDLNDSSTVVEIAANDGYLLQYVQANKIPCYGIEPTGSAAQVARDKGLDIIEIFFGEEKAEELSWSGKQADLMVANNVLAHVPDINDFVKGFATLLKSGGVATFEFPHILNLVQKNQFDTIYHEHFSYLSLIAVENIFTGNGLSVFDVEQLPTHGGSLRVYAQRSDAATHSVNERVLKMRQLESDAGINNPEFYQGFQTRVDKIKLDFLDFLLHARKQGKLVAAYGAAAKGNTLLNYMGIRSDLVQFVVDLNPKKQGKFMPGSRIPILSEDQILKDKPDYIVILPWNLKLEIMQQLSYVQDWGSQFVVAVPELEII